VKNSIFIILLFGYFLNTFGQSNVNYPQDGIYGGVEIGVAFVNISGLFSNVISKVDGDEFLSEEYTKSVVGVNFGYGKYIGESMIGIEGHFSLYTKKIDETFILNDYAFDISLSSKSEIDIIIGRKIGVKSLLTLRGGIAFSNINIIAESTSGIDRYKLDSKWNGYSLGMGYVYGINEKLSIKTKYNLTTFKNNKFPETKSKLVDNRATLSLIYRIGN